MFVTPHQGDPEPEELQFSRRWSKQLASGKLTFPEYFLSLTRGLISVVVEYLTACLGTIQPEVLGPYADHLRDSLVPVDFMPYPFIFFGEQNTESERERIRQRLRPPHRNPERVLGN